MNQYEREQQLKIERLKKAGLWFSPQEIKRLGRLSRRYRNEVRAARKKGEPIPAKPIEVDTYDNRHKIAKRLMLGRIQNSRAPKVIVRKKEDRADNA